MVAGENLRRHVSRIFPTSSPSSLSYGDNSRRSRLAIRRWFGLKSARFLGELLPVRYPKQFISKRIIEKGSAYIQEGWGTLSAAAERKKVSASAGAVFVYSLPYLCNGTSKSAGRPNGR